MVLICRGNLSVCVARLLDDVLLLLQKFCYKVSTGKFPFEALLRSKDEHLSDKANSSACQTTNRLRECFFVEKSDSLQREWVISNLLFKLKLQPTKNYKSIFVYFLITRLLRTSTILAFDGDLLWLTLREPLQAFSMSLKELDNLLRRSNCVASLLQPVESIYQWVSTSIYQ